MTKPRRHISELTDTERNEIHDWWQANCPTWPLHSGIHEYLTTHRFWFNPEKPEDRNHYDNLYRHITRQQNRTVIEQLSLDLLASANRGAAA